MARGFAESESDMSETSSANQQQRSAAKRTAAWLALVALGVYAMFIYLGATR